VHHIKNGRYFQGGGQWTDNVERAVDFEHGERAGELAVGMELKQIEMVAEVEEEGFENQRADGR